MDDSRVPFAYGQRNSHWEWLAYDDVQSMHEKVGSRALRHSEARRGIAYRE